MNPFPAAALCLSVALSITGSQPAQPGAEQHPGGGHPQIPRPAADWPKAHPEDVKSIDAVVTAFYSLAGGAAGESRDWDRYRSLFLPQGRMVAARPAADGTAGAFFLTIGEYVDANRKYFEKGGYFDHELGRRVESFGLIAHVWSAYESRHVKDSPEPYARGINSIELLKDGDRWWIVSVYWDYERPESPIPAEYLKGEAK